jgi:hypothetical protein
MYMYGEWTKIEGDKYYAVVLCVMVDNAPITGAD